MTIQMTEEYILILEGVGFIKAIGGNVKLRRGDSNQPVKEELEFIIINVDCMFLSMDGDKTWAKSADIEVPCMIEIMAS